MRTTLTLTAAAVLIGAICFAGDKATTKSTAPADTKSTDTTAESKPLTLQQSADEALIRGMNDAFAKAYAAGDAKSVAAHFTTDAEYVDELGNVYQGRAAIQDSFTEYFADNAGGKIEMSIDSLRFISPGVAVEDGNTKITRSENQSSVVSHYTTIHVKTDGQWLAASVRDHAPKDRRQHRAQLQQLNWLVGDWVDEGDDSLVTFSCKSVDHDNFLLRTFTIQVAGQEAMSGTQRIGWDPLTGKLRTWIFDSEGAYGEGLWHRDGDDWVLKVVGVTADGQASSSTSVYTYVNDHRMTWQSIHHEIGGVQQPNSAVITIVRQAPAPSADIAEDRK